MKMDKRQMGIELSQSLENDVKHATEQNQEHKSEQKSEQSAENLQEQNIAELMQQLIDVYSKELEALMSTVSVLQKEVEEKSSDLRNIDDVLTSVVNNIGSGVAAISSEGKEIFTNQSYEDIKESIGVERLKQLLQDHEQDLSIIEEPNNSYKFRLSPCSIAGEPATIVVIEDISDLKSMEKQLQRDENLRLMGFMAANIAHDIRNPLGAITINASLIKKDSKGIAGLDKLSDKILLSVNTVEKIIANMLDLTKGKGLDLGIHKLSDILDEVVVQNSHLLLSKSVELIRSFDDDYQLYCDSELLQQALQNLITNSVQAMDSINSLDSIDSRDSKDSLDTTRSNSSIDMENSLNSLSSSGVIEIRTKDTRDFHKILIKDNGRGISPDMTDRLFLPFQTDKAKGTGLGLAIVYKIIREHGGEVFAESNGKSYTTINIKLPKALRRSK